jgi:hypothetical protein
MNYSSVIKRHRESYRPLDGGEVLGVSELAGADCWRKIGESLCKR